MSMSRSWALGGAIAMLAVTTLVAQAPAGGQGGRAGGQGPGAAGGFGPAVRWKDADGAASDCRRDNRGQGEGFELEGAEDRVGSS